MAALTDKLNNIRRQQDLRYKEAIWTLLLGYGAALINQTDELYDVTDAFSYKLKADRELTKSFCERIAATGVDLEASSDPASSKDVGFLDTLDTRGFQIDVLSGVLVAGDGTRARWGARLADGVGFEQLLPLLSHDLRIEDGIAELQARIAAGNYETEIF